jgi:hypothetical protein
MTFDLDRPRGLDDDNWAAVQAYAGRVERAQRESDLEHMIGAAKDLVESIAKIVVAEAGGEVVPSNMDLPDLLAKAHVAMRRMPVGGKGAETVLMQTATAASKTIRYLAELRNKFGTGHGRVVRPEVEDEDAQMCVELAVWWARWALRRLNKILVAQPKILINELNEGVSFYKNNLKDWLATNLGSLESSDQRLVGVAVGQRAMRETYTVTTEGVEACASDPSLTAWPAPYREGLAEGLFLSPEGFVDIAPWGAEAAARIIAPHPEVDKFLTELESKLGHAGFADRFGPQENYEVARAMRASADAVPEGPARDAWNRISVYVDLDA